MSSHLDTIYTLLGVFAAALSILAGLRHAGRRVLVWIESVQAWRRAVEHNTTATSDLSGKFEAHQEAQAARDQLIAEQLADHGRRLVDHDGRLSHLEKQGATLVEQQQQHPAGGATTILPVVIPERSGP